MSIDSMTCEKSGPPIFNGLTLLPEGSLAKTFPQQESGSVLMTENALVYGERCGESFASYDRDSQSWRTSQLCLDQTLAEFSETWPRAGLMRSGIVSPLAPLAPLIDGTAFSFVPTPQACEFENPKLEYRSLTNAYRGDKKVQPTLADVVKLLPPRGLWPTPRAQEKDGYDVDASGNKRPPLSLAVKMWPTPQAQDAKNVNQAKTDYQTLPSAMLKQEGSGRLNPQWVEWLMGYPIEHTDCGDSAIASSRKSRSGSAEGS